MVDSARKYREEYREEYREGQSERSKVISSFRKDIYDAINDVASFFIPKNISYEKLLCSILLFGDCAEGFFYEMAKNLPCNQEYKKMEISTIDEMSRIIDINIPSEYVFNENIYNTYIRLWFGKL